MSGRWPFTAEKIASRLALIAPFIHRKKVSLGTFRLLELDEARVDAPIHADASNWDVVANETYWGRTDLNFILKTELTVPDDWAAENLALHLPLGVMGDIFNHPEALVHIDGELIGSADRHHHTIPIDGNFADGKEHTLALVGWTGLAGWPPDKASKSKLFMGRTSLVQVDEQLQSYVDLATVALDAAKILPPGCSEKEKLLLALDEAFKVLDTRDPIGDAFYASVEPAMKVLRAGIEAAGEPLDHVLHGIGHAHMDIAYLWPISQIRLKNARTYSNVLRLMEADDGYIFSHSQPQLYAMVEADYPDIFSQIKDRVAEGRWEVMGGTWVEPDLNIPGPEPLVQQFVLGRQYFKEKFGDVETPVLWLPDTFGFPAQIPQLMRLAKLKWFATNKLNWNQVNKVPSSTHHWEGLDGSRVLAHVLTTPREVQYLPFPTNYKSDLSAAEVYGTVADPTIPKQLSALPICYGYGDGGGGPTRELLAKAHAFGKMPSMPQFKMSNVRNAFEAMEEVAHTLPVWRGEHYMEGHRGVLTSQAWIKRANRFAERALHEAEAVSVMAGLSPDLTEAWQLLCLNQFHDIITGTAIAEVFDDARKDFARIGEIAECAASKAAEKLSGHSVAVVNTSPISGPRTVEGPDGEALYFENLPAYSVVPLENARAPGHPARASETANGACLENQHMRVEIDTNGHLLTVIDKATGINVLKQEEAGNLFQAFEDRPLSWDAWDIDPFFEDRMEIVSGATDFQIEEDGPVRAKVQIKTKWRNSTVRQTIQLCANSKRLDFITEVDWHETHTLLKVAFPTRIVTPKAEFDIQWGSVERSTTRQTSFDAARFEVAAQKWACLKDERGMVAVLNDCKYGCDVRDSTIRLTLIKSATFPDPQSDQGAHKFTYSLFVGERDNRAALDHEAYALNTSPRILPAVQNRHNSDENLPASFVQTAAENIIIETLKPGIDGKSFLIRIFESSGQKTKADVTFNRTVSEVHFAELDGSPISKMKSTGSSVSVLLNPFEIQTLLVIS